MDDIKDLRTAERFMVDAPIEGYFGRADVAIHDLAESGVQVVHAEPLRLATRARLGFRLGATAVTVPAIVIWSRLSQTPDPKGKLLYRSGLRLEANLDSVAGAINTLAGMGLLRHDRDSLYRKKRKIEDKEQEIAVRSAFKPVLQATQLSPDQLLLVQHARERLRSHPDEALKWYNRAKYSHTDEALSALDDIANRDEVFAVWEYLERSIDLMTIVHAFEQRKS